MKRSFLERAAQFVRKQRKHAWWLASVACLALVVMAGTVFAFIRQGQASVYTEKELDCPVTVHEHAPVCYDGEDRLVCGFADYVVHTHNADCYDGGGQLACTLGEVEEHIHDASCRMLHRELVCVQKEFQGHLHTQDCYSVPEVCPLEEHVHGESCYIVDLVPAEDDPEHAGPAEDGAEDAPGSGEPGPQLVEVWTLACTLEEHAHGDACQGKLELTCPLEETGEGHVHGEDCYQETEELTCGQIELHIHTADCYEGGWLICGQLELCAHVHGEGCFRIHELDPEEVADLTPQEPEQPETPEIPETPEVPEIPETPDVPPEPEEHQHTEACYGPPVLTCVQEEHVHSQDCYTVAPVPGTPEGGAGSGEVQEPADLTCGKTEHIHAGACYGGRTLICGQEETPEAPPETPGGENQPDPQPGGSGTACGLEEHVHSDVCISLETLELVCGMAEHSHTEECLGPDPVEPPWDSWNPPEIPEPPEDDSECICGLIQHEHTNGCYFFGMLFCRLPEHIHDTTCLPEEPKPEPLPEPLCGVTEHTHTEACWSGSGELLCPLPEHVHSESCWIEPVEPETVVLENESFEYTGDSFQVAFHIRGGARTAVAETGPASPARAGEGLAFDVQSVGMASEEYQSAYQFAEGTGDTVLDLQVLRFSARLNGRTLDLSECEIQAEIVPTQELIQYAEGAAGAPVAPAAEGADLPADEPERQVTVAALRLAGEEDLPELLDAAPIGSVSQSAMIVPLAATDSGSVAIYAAREASREVTVQYYANIERVVHGNTGKLAMIDTSGGRLPVDSSAPLFYLDLDEKDQIRTEEKLAPLYRDVIVPYAAGLDLADIDPFRKEDSNYALAEVWVLKDGSTNPDSLEKGDWDIYPAGEFTANQIKGGSVIRLVADPKATVRTTGGVQFYDYSTDAPGSINSAGNYGENVELICQIEPGARPLKCGQGTSEGWISCNKTEGTTYICGFSEEHAHSEKPAEPYEGSSCQDGCWRWEGNQNWETKEWSGQWKLECWKKEHTHTENCREYHEHTDACYSDRHKHSDTCYGEPHVHTVSCYFAPDETSIKFGGGSAGINGEINQNDPTDTAIANCTFGLVQSLDGEGCLVYSSPYTAPHLFNEGSAIGKTYVNGYSLGFDRMGDTYTLACVLDENGRNVSSGCDHTEKSLDTFVSTTTKELWTNCFWPMDTQGTHNPPSASDGYDDGGMHNSYFGMQYSITFTMAEEYVGPLDYYFYGDDDLWVFLDGKLVCDVGGVHSSIGEYVDLWDYIKEGDTGSHTLSVFFMERGSYGSSCYMRFTLPSPVAILPPDVEPTGDLEIRKVMDGGESNQEFAFRLELDGIAEAYEYKRYHINGDVTTGTIASGLAELKLRANEYITIPGLPVGTRYTITETDSGGFTPSISVNGVIKEAETAEGQIGVGTNSVQFTNRAAYQLPSAGGYGDLLYTLSGGLLLAAATLVFPKKQSKRKEGR